jgi:serine/threonine protein kinase
MTEIREKAFGGYELVREIGAGGFSAVFEAHRENLPNIKVALKRAKNSEDESQRKRLWLEAEAFNALGEHQNLVRVIDYQPNNGIPFVVLEKCDSSLEDKLNGIKNRKLSWREAVDITTQMLRGLKVVHDNEKVGYHGDLKPSNVLLKNENGRVVAKLADFGAQTGERMPSNSVAHLGSVVGERELTSKTLAYLAPEQIQGGRITPATDIHQTGQILYEMISGVTFSVTQGRDVPSNHDAPKWLDEFVMNTTNPNQKSRPTPKQALSHLERGLNGKFDGPTFTERMKRPFVSGVKNLRRGVGAVANLGFNVVKYGTYPAWKPFHLLGRGFLEDNPDEVIGGMVLLSAYAGVGSWINEEVQENRTFSMASKIFRESEDSLVFLRKGIGEYPDRLGIAPLNRILSEEQEIRYINLPRGIANVAGVNGGKFIYATGDSSIFTTDLETGSSERLFDLYGKHDRNYAGVKFDEVGLARSSGDLPPEVVLRSREQWYKLSDGSLVEIVKPELLGRSPNVPNSNFKFERDKFPYNGIYLARQSSGWGDRLVIDVYSHWDMMVAPGLGEQLQTGGD